MAQDYAGPVSELAAAPPEDLEELFARAPYLTKLSSDSLTDAQIAEDFVFTVAGSAGGGEDSWRTLVVGLVIGLVVVAYLAWRRRRSSSSAA